MQAVLDDWTTADVPERTRAALRLLEAMTLHPLDIDAAFVDALRHDGLDDEAIREAANVGFHFNFINRVADAFGFPLPSPEGQAKLARMLNLVGRLIRGSQADPVWTHDEQLGMVQPTEIYLGRQQMLSVEGQTEPELRAAIEGYVTARWEHRARAEGVPAELCGYLDKLARHAYRIIDEDIDALRDAGYDDDAIYEITIVGSFAAALVGVERVSTAMVEPQTAAAA